MSSWLSSTEHDPDILSRGQLLRPSFYWSILSRRWVQITIPLLVISLAGVAVATHLPATYLSEGKLIVQPQQVSTELVHPSVTSTAQDRIQVIQQRTMSRDNLLEIRDKYLLFPDQGRSANEIVELMRKNIKITVIDPTPEFNQRSRGLSPPVIFTVGFEYSDAETAEKVASELIKRMLDEDIRDRTERATSTTKFMTEEFQKLLSESADLDSKVSELRASLRKSAVVTSETSDSTQLSQLREEYAQKSAMYSEQHPVLQSLKRQIQALESTRSRAKSTSAESVADLEALVAKQEAARKTLDQAAARLTTARAGENLEKNQQSEKLDVLEQPAVPQRATKPNRLKVALTAVVAGLGAGIFLAYVSEALDTSIRSYSDIASLIDRQFVTAIPVIATRAERRRRNSMLFLVTLTIFTTTIAASLSYRSMVPQFDELVTKAKSNFSQ